MLSSLLPILGGLGMFLLGMAVMTQGLKDLAGDSLSRALAKFTRNPVSGAATGTVSTALIQSSSATTVMAVGFVGAGLITFPQALGIIFGANIGTTATGWLVALLGFKLNLKQIVLPLIFLGALLRLFGRQRVAAAGYAVAGFGLVFVGIAALQDGMEAYRDVVTPASFPPDAIAGRLLLVLIGVAITLVTQSSSAGVATAITAVHVGNVSLSQAAALVIGMDVGTTVTAAIAAVGGNVNARRTGLAHVIYNLLTAVGALILLPIYVHAWEALAPATARADPEIALVGFHTLFNTVGVLTALPLTNQFAALIVRLVPAHESQLTRRLEPSLVKQPSIAIQAVVATLVDVTSVAFSALSELLSGKETGGPAEQLEQADLAAKETRRYLNQVRTTNADSNSVSRSVVAHHVLDHLARLIVRCRKTDRLAATREDPELSPTCAELAQIVVRDFPDPSTMSEMDMELERLWGELDQRAGPYRRHTIERTAAGDVATDQAIARLDTIRWLRRVCYHTWRICHHLASEHLEAFERGEIEEAPEEYE